MENNAKRVFLTGAGGFIASHILSLLIEVGPSTEAHTSRTN
jgi:nucleoside-diphosphate-sugar epimerase